MQLRWIHQICIRTKWMRTTQKSIDQLIRAFHILLDVDDGLFSWPPHLLQTMAIIKLTMLTLALDSLHVITLRPERFITFQVGTRNHNILPRGCHSDHQESTVLCALSIIHQFTPSDAKTAWSPRFCNTRVLKPSMVTTSAVAGWTRTRAAVPNAVSWLPLTNFTRTGPPSTTDGRVTTAVPDTLTASTSTRMTSPELAAIVAPAEPVSTNVR